VTLVTFSGFFDAAHAPMGINPDKVTKATVAGQRVRAVQ
jgi:hypothetical protein